MLLTILLYLVAPATAATIDAPPQEYVRAASKVTHGQLLLAMSYVESRYNIDAVGDLGELGPLQLRPEYHPKVRGAKTVLDHFRIADRYLTKLQRQCSYLGDAWFICYNLGVRKARQMYANLVIDNARQNSYARKVTEANRALRKWTPIQDKVPSRYAADGKEVRRVATGRGHTGRLQIGSKHDLRKEGPTRRGTRARSYARNSPRHGAPNLRAWRRGAGRYDSKLAFEVGQNN